MAIQRPTLETKQVITPDTGITVTLKTKFTRGDEETIYNQVFGTDSVTTDNGTPNVTVAQAMHLADATVLAMATDWDVVEADGTATPLNQDNFLSVLTSNDVNFLMDVIRPTEEAKKK